MFSAASILLDLPRRMMERFFGSIGHFDWQKI